MGCRIVWGRLGGGGLGGCKHTADDVTEKSRADMHESAQKKE